MLYGYPFIKYKAFAFPETLCRGYLLQIAENTAFEMVNLLKAMV